MAEDCPWKEQLFTDACDIKVDECMVEEMYYSMIGRHELHILDDAGTVKNIYGEPALGETPQYTQTVTIPMHIKLDPEAEELDRFGYDRTREAVVWFSRKILKDLGIDPKVGDRIDFTYRSTLGSVINEHLIINEISLWDFQRQAKHFYQITAACNRTHKLYQPDPPGTPTDPREDPLDEPC